MNSVTLDMPSGGYCREHFGQKIGKHSIETIEDLDEIESRQFSQINGNILIYSVKCISIKFISNIRR